MCYAHIGVGYVPLERVARSSYVGGHVSNHGATRASSLASRTP